MTEEALTAVLATYRDDPVLFCEDLLVPLREWQPEAARMVAANSHVALKTCRAAGKTFLAASLAIWYLTTRPACLACAIAPTWRQTSHFMVTLAAIWQRSKLRALLPGWELLQDELRTTVADWRLIAMSAEQGERVEGAHGREGTFLVFDEARGIPDGIFASMTQMTSHPASKTLAISTPGLPVGWYYRCFLDAA